MSSEHNPTFFHSIHQVLVAYDDSPFAQHAFAVAMEIARQGEAEVTAAHVVPSVLGYIKHILYPYAALGADSHSIEAELLDAAKQNLLEQTAPLRAHPDPESKTPPNDDELFEIYAHIMLGDTVGRLRESISKTNADLVLVGAFGNAPPTPGQIGNVARRLAASATRPTLIVKDPGGPVHFKRVLVALDGSRASAGLLNYAVSLALLFGADVEIVTAVPDPHRGDREGLLDGVKLHRDARNKASQKAKRNVERAREGLYVPFPFEKQLNAMSLQVHTPVGDPLDAILELIEDRGHDLVVAATRHPDNKFRSRFGRVTDGLCRLAGAHVLVIPVDLTVGDDTRA